MVYTVESHNLTADDSLTLANSLMYVTPPEPSGGDETGVERVFTIGVPPSVQSGEIAAIGVNGEGEVLLTAQDGYFPATGENTVVVSGGTSSTVGAITSRTRRSISTSTTLIRVPSWQVAAQLWKAISRRRNGRCRCAVPS